jgi:hypothetical protein
VKNLQISDIVVSPNQPEALTSDLFSSDSKAGSYWIENLLDHRMKGEADE